MKRYPAIFERDESGSWLARIPSIRGCHTYGRTLEQARTRLREALGLWIDRPEHAVIEEATASRPISGPPFSEAVVHANVQNGSRRTPRRKLVLPPKRSWRRASVFETPASSWDYRTSGYNSSYRLDSDRD